MAKRPALVDLEAFARAARTAGDHRLARRFGVACSTARRYRLRLLGKRTPLPQNPNHLTDMEKRVVAVCWSHVGSRGIAEALGRNQRTVSEYARFELAMPPERPNWRRRGEPVPVAARPTPPAGGLRWRCDCGRLVIGSPSCACGNLFGTMARGIHTGRR